jgi:hypothetical protein
VLVFPYYDLDGNYTGFHRDRLHAAKRKNGKARHYQQAPNSGLHAYFPASCRERLRDVRRRVIITEGEKKALAIAQLGYTVVGLGGVDCDCQRNDKGEYEIIADLKAMPWEGRTVFIVFDFDPKESTRRNVMRAARRLARCLKRAGAVQVRWVVLPAGLAGSKQGADDFLVREGGNAFDRLVIGAGPMTGMETFRNFFEKAYKNSKGENVVTPVGLAQQDIHQDLIKFTDNWPRRVGPLLFAPHNFQAQWLETSNQLFAWIGRHLDEPIQWIDDGTDKVSGHLPTLWLARIRFELSDARVMTVTDVAIFWIISKKSIKRTLDNTRARPENSTFGYPAGDARWRSAWRHARIPGDKPTTTTAVLHQPGH